MATGITPADMIKIAFEKLVARTGRSVDDWVETARGSGLTGHRDITLWLKQTHGLNHNEAQWIAWGVTDPGRAEQYDRPTDLVAELYSDKKAALRPLYDKLMETGLALGPDVTSFVCKTYTSLSTRVQFVIFVPRVAGAIDIEIALPDGYEAPGLSPFKSSNPKFKQRFRVRSVEEISPEVVAAMQVARQTAG